MNADLRSSTADASPVTALPWRETADAAASTDDYARRFAGPTGAWMLSVQSVAILRLLGAQGVSSVLDVGGGHAQVAPPLLGAGYEVTALVSGPDALGRLPEIPPHDGRFAVEQGDLMHLPHPDRAFDAVVSMRTMSHVRDWPAFLAELCRVADRAVVIDFSSDRARGRVGTALFALKRRIEGNTRRYAVTGMEEIADVLDRQGFDVAGHVGQFVLPMVVHRMLKRARLSARLERALGRMAARAGNPVVLCATRRGGAP